MADYRPANCRFRLQEEGKNYPRSSCAACGRTITTGLGTRCHRETDLIPRADAELAVAEAIRRAAEAGANIAERTRPDGFPEVASNAYHSGAMDVVDAIRALAPADALDEVQALRKTYDELYQDALADAKSDAQDFDSDLWTMVRAYLDELNLDWRDYSDDGITADEVLTHIRECMNEETRRAEAAEAEVQRLRARVTSLSEQVDTIAEQRDASDAEVQRLREESAERHALHLEQVRITSEWIAERDAALAQLNRHLSIFADHAAVVWGIIRAAGDLPGLADGPYKDGFIGGMEEVAARGDIQAADGHHQLQNLCEQIVALVTGQATLVMAPADEVASKMAAAAERDAALARVEKLRHQITEASDPDFLFGAMDNVNDMDVTLDQFAAAASRAIRAALATVVPPADTGEGRA